VNPEGPSALKLIGIVALGVAAVILVFFAVGYGLGRLFLKGFGIVRQRDRGCRPVHRISSPESCSPSSASTAMG
jgi:hypothetical protein